MITPVFTTLNASNPVKALLGSAPLRVYPWGQAPENAALPYATYGVYSGVPENYLQDRGDIDNAGTQIDIWAKTGVSANACFEAIRTAFEGVGYLTAFQSTAKDAETELFTNRMEYDFWVTR